MYISLYARRKRERARERKRVRERWRALERSATRRRLATVVISACSSSMLLLTKVLGSPSAVSRVIQTSTIFKHESVSD